jgi:ligand-binding sensor domain-containing protein
MKYAQVYVLFLMVVFFTYKVRYPSTWALSRYDQKSLHDKKPTVTKIMSERTGTFSGILEGNDGSIWFGSNGGLYRYDGKTITDFRSKDDQK